MTHMHASIYVRSHLTERYAAVGVLEDMETTIGVLASRLPAFFGKPFVPLAAHTVHANANSANNPPLDETTAAILRSRLDLEELEHLHQAITSNLKHQAAACTIQAMIANPASFDGPWTFLKVQPTLWEKAPSVSVKHNHVTTPIPVGDTTMSNAHARCLGQAKDMVSALGLAQQAASGFTSRMYFDATRTLVLKEYKLYWQNSVDTPLERETCVLQKLQQFPWAPRLFCAGTDYILTSYSGQPACQERLPQDYMTQMATILSDIQSVGVRHNDLHKGYETDFLMDERTGRLSLVDYGWASLNGSLAMSCTAHGGRVVSAKGTRPHNPIINLGFKQPETPLSVSMPRCAR